MGPLPNNVVPVNYTIVGNYIIGDTKNSVTNNNGKVTGVVQAVHPNLVDKVAILEAKLGRKDLTEKSIVKQTLETQIESLNSVEAKDALDAVEKELKQREAGNSDSWTWGWLNSSNSGSSWGLSGIWNWMSSFLANLGNYKTETLQATREALIKKVNG